MANYIKSDLEFILDQIKIAEAHAAGTPLAELIASPTLSFGLRTVDGTYNNLLPGRDTWGAADQPFLELVAPEYLPGYTPGPGTVIDAQPRVISNLIVDQSTNNPAANEASGGVTETVDGINGPVEINVIPNVAPDEGLSAPFNSWMTLFGQFFDHGLDLVNKGGSGTVFIPLQEDDPLYVEGSPTNFMVLTRANRAGPDGILQDDPETDVDESADNTAPINATSPFVDQNQTYASHPAHQVFLREYVLVQNPDAAEGVMMPVATGRLIQGSNGGMATWADVKTQAEDVLGIRLVDADATRVPLVATDEYGNFLPGPNGFPQLIQTTGMAEGNLDLPVNAALAIASGHMFLADIAHNADPSNGKVADADGVANPTHIPLPAGFYDDELLNAHFMAGDGRANENIGLTAVHHVFHSEHNRLVGQTKDVILEAFVAGNASPADVAFLNEWLDGTGPGGIGTIAAGTTSLTPVQIANLDWNGERIFQAAKFGTEMQYQHLVFEDFARKIQPQIDVFVAPIGYNTEINPAIFAEFAHTVYRFGHSMLTETIDRFDEDFGIIGAGWDTSATAEQIGLVEAFLNPIEFDNGGTIDADVAAGAVIRGMTRQVGNEIDEFVTEALRNNLLGLPLDLATINLARGRDTGLPSLNEFREEYYDLTGDSQLAPYTSWFDFAMHLKNQTSIINFIAAYGTHGSITGATTLIDKRAAALLMVMGGDGAPSDAEDFFNATGVWEGVETGLNNVDLWIGGLAEAIMPFGGMLGSTFNFVFETQLENLQDGDRFYYLARTAGMNFLTELEQNSFASLIMQNTDTTHLPIDVFSTPAYILEVDRVGHPQFNEGLGNVDPAHDGIVIVPLVIRNNPATSGADSNYLRYTGGDHVVLGGTDPGTYNPTGNDILIASIGDDTIFGDGGNDRIEGGHGNDNIDGGAGDDIIQDMGGDDVIKGNSGNDVIHGGPGINLLIGGTGRDFIITGEDIGEVFAGGGDDFIFGAITNEAMHGNEGNDWIEKGTQDGAMGDNANPFGLDDIEGHDVFLGSGSFDEYVGEGGDDIMVGSAGQNRNEGMSGFDWMTYKDNQYDPFLEVGVFADLLLPAFDEEPIPPSPATALDRYENVEGVSGSHFDDVLLGTDVTAADILLEGAQGSLLKDANIDLIAGLRALITPHLNVDGDFDAGNIMLGGDGNDLFEGRGGDDIIDGDKWLNVRISVRPMGNPDGPELATFDSLEPLIPLMLNGTYNPGQLHIVREILTADGAGDVDTARYIGNILDYDIQVDGDVMVVTDLVGEEGTDTLYNVEVLQFADGIFVNNDEPEGVLAINGFDTENSVNPTEGLELTASLGSIADGDGMTSSILSYRWQQLIAGVWEDITPSATGATFSPTQAQVNQLVRVAATYVDDGGTAEEVFSHPTNIVGDLIVGTNAINDLSGTDGYDNISGLNGNDTLNGLGGDDILDGGANNDVLNGGDGNDFLDGGANNDVLNGGDGNDTLRGGLNGGTDTMNGGLGADAMTGGDGSDTYSVDDAGDEVTEVVADADTDIVNTTLNTYTMPDGVERVFFLGVGAFTGTGNAGANWLTGAGGDDTLDGREGDDRMAGLAGDDTYHVDSASDLTVELAGGGTDTVYASVTDTLNANVENLILVESAGNIGGIGSAIANTMTGNSGNNTLSGANGNDVIDGLDGDDTLNGDAGNDTLNGGEGIDTLNGGDGTDTLNGGAGIDTLNGGAGNDTLNGDDGANIFGDADTMNGGEGNDTYIVGFGDQATDSGANGTDVVNTSLNTYQMLGGIERLFFIGGFGDFTGTGNALANWLTGNGGNDTLDGGAGIDRLVGLAGDDIYVVDNAADVLVEAVLGGTDTEHSSVTDTLAANVENMLLTGSADIDGIGNALVNVMTGNSGGNTLSGLNGDDVLHGMEGDDELLGGANNDTLDGGEGSDSLDGGTGNDSLHGSSGNDSLTGGAGNDVMIGGEGDDFLDGGTGFDTFQFETATLFGNDSVTGFDHDVGGGGQDLIDLTGFGITATTFAASVQITGTTTTVVTVLDGDMNAYGTITLSGVNSANVSITDFVLA